MQIRVYITGILSDGEVRSLAKTVQIKDPEKKRDEAAEAILSLMTDNNITMDRLSYSGWFDLPSEREKSFRKPEPSLATRQTGTKK